MTVLPFTLRQLEVFERVCETRSFRRASEELGISQASVSNQLKVLEEQLGIRLMLREAGKRPGLTSEGAAFLADLGRFREAALALAAHRRARPEEAHQRPVTLNVLVGAYLFKDFVRPKLSQFFEDNRHIELEIASPLIDRDLRKEIGREKHQLAIFHDEPGHAYGLGYRELARTSCGIYGHPKFLAGSGRGLSAEEISALPHLLPSEGTYNEGLVLRRLARSGIKPRHIAGRTPYFDVLVDALERGDAVGAVTDAMFTKFAGRKSVKLFPIDDIRLALYRSPGVHPPEVDVAERFLISAILDDPDYPVVEGTRAD